MEAVAPRPWRAVCKGPDMRTKRKRMSSTGNVVMALTGVGLIAFAASCFTEVPLIGTVFLMPGDKIFNARVVDPGLRHVLFLTGGIFAAAGVFLHLRGALNDQSKSASEGATPAHATCISLTGIREAKELLDSGAISGKEYKRIKEKLIR